MTERRLIGYRVWFQAEWCDDGRRMYIEPFEVSKLIHTFWKPGLKRKPKPVRLSVAQDLKRVAAKSSTLERIWIVPVYRRTKAKKLKSQWCIACGKSYAYEKPSGGFYCHMCHASQGAMVKPEKKTLGQVFSAAHVSQWSKEGFDVQEWSDLADRAKRGAEAGALAVAEEVCRRVKARFPHDSHYRNGPAICWRVDEVLSELKGER